MSDSTTQARRGRPRDPEVDRRITAATVLVTGNAGPRNLTITAVADEAGSSKASVYVRADSAEELLERTIAELELEPETVRAALLLLSEILELEARSSYGRFLVALAGDTAWRGKLRARLLELEEVRP